MRLFDIRGNRKVENSQFFHEPEGSLYIDATQSRTFMSPFTATPFVPVAHDAQFDWSVFTNSPLDPRERRHCQPLDVSSLRFSLGDILDKPCTRLVLQEMLNLVATLFGGYAVCPSRSSGLGVLVGHLLLLGLLREYRGRLISTPRRTRISYSRGRFSNSSRMTPSKRTSVFQGPRLVGSMPAVLSTRPRTSSWASVIDFSLKDSLVSLPVASDRSTASVPFALMSSALSNGCLIFTPQGRYFHGALAPHLRRL